MKDDILLVLKLEISYRVDVLYAYVQAQYQTRYLVRISISEPALVMLAPLSCSSRYKGEYCLLPFFSPCLPLAQSIFLRKKIDDAQT